jgi:AAA domain
MRRTEDMPPEWQRRNPPTIQTGNDLRNKEFPPISWAVPGVLPAGVTLFGGREKMGKSWLAFGLCIAVAAGGYALGKMPVEKGPSLYLSLEDPERRLHKRIRRLASDDTDLSDFHYATGWPTADRGGVDDLDGWLEENQRCRLVAIDTLKRIRPRSSGKRNPYEEDYEAIQPFATLAAKHNTAIVVLHHLNQQSEPHDPFDAFSGSAGLTAAADGIWLLTRKRGDADAFLMVDGKDIEEPQELALGWDAATCAWKVQGDAATYRLNKERREIVEVMEAWDEPMGPKAVANALDKDYDQTRQLMYKMAGDGQLTQEGYGKYVVAQGTVYIDNIGNTSPNGSGVNDVNDVNAPYREKRNGRHPLLADEQNRLFHKWVDEGMAEKDALNAVKKRMQREEIVNEEKDSSRRP